MLPTPERSADWLAAVARRHSRRTFETAAVDPGVLDAIDALCAQFRPYPDARTELIRHPSVDIFTGIVGGYGKVSGAPHALLFIGDTAAPFHDQHVGYTGEALVLEATALSVSTCWVGGFFDAKRALTLTELAPGERIVAVSPLGIGAAKASVTERSMTGMAGSSHRKPLETIAPGGTEGWPAWAVAALETARLAPSAVNRQPWRFRWDGTGLVLALNNKAETPKVRKRLDCGIAMLHAEIAAGACGVTGEWTDLDSGLDVARFVPTEVSS